MTWFYKEKEQGDDIINIINIITSLGDVVKGRSVLFFFFNAAISKVTFQEHNSPMSHTRWKV